jgi:hypothetical protein
MTLSLSDLSIRIISLSVFSALFLYSATFSAQKVAFFSSPVYSLLFLFIAIAFFSLWPVSN